MKHIALLSALFLMTTCGGNTVSNAPTCDTAGMPLSHQTKAKGAATSNGSEYHISISIGGKAMDAIADTGSSNLIVANNIGFTPSNAQNSSFQIQYGDSANLTTVSLDVYSGTVGLDCLKADAVSGYQYGYIKNFTPAQNSGEVQQTLLGLAYAKAQAQGSPAKQTFVTQLSTTAKMNNEFAMLLCGAGNKNSNITFGGTGVGKEAFQYVPIIEQSYYVINAGKISLKAPDGKITETGTSLTNAPKTILDSGTTLNIVPVKVFTAIQTAVEAVFPGSTNNPGTETTCPSAAQLAQLPTVLIALDNSVTLSIAPNTYFKKLEGGGCFFGFQGVDNAPETILGQVTMENYHVHFVREYNKAILESKNLGAIGFSPNTACKN